VTKKTRNWEIEMMKELERDRQRLKTIAYIGALVCALVFVAFILRK
jgi:hypothetical protein